MIFTAAELDRFAAATGDRNPLHTSPGYSRATPFGEPVVFGVLIALRLLTSEQLLPRERPWRVRMGFPRPAFAQGRYRIDNDERTDVRTLRDGAERAAWVLTAAPEPVGSAPAPGPADPGAMREVAAGWTPGVSADALAGHYVCDPAALRALLGAGAAELSDTELATLVLPSYLAGMELPGRQALLVDIDVTLAAAGDGTAAGLTWDVQVERYQPRYGMVTVAGRLFQAGVQIATVRYRALVRTDAFTLDLDAVAAQLPSSRASFAGRRALVVGGSRGLGAVLGAQLALCGAKVVVTYQASEAAAADLVATVGAAGGRLEAIQADARDPSAWKRVRDALGSETPLDLLVCSAWPPLVRGTPAGSGVDPGTRHVAEGLRMVALPLAELLPAMTGARRDVLVLSSRFVSDPDPGFWHYISGKAAAEQLCRTLAVRTPGARFVLARPPALATDYVATAGASALAPEIAGRVMLEACAGGGPGVVVLDAEFDAARAAGEDVARSVDAR